MKKLITILMSLAVLLLISTIPLKAQGEIDPGNKPTVQSKAVNVWTGSVNSSWGNGGNWTLGHYPNSTEDAVITTAGAGPVRIYWSDKACNNLTIQAGAGISVEDKKLTVNGDMDVYGYIEMVDNAGILEIMGNTVWESGSYANVTASTATISAYGNWDFNSGSNVNFSTGNVDFYGNATSYIRCKSNSSSFNRLRLLKTGGAIVGFSGASNYDLVVNLFLSVSSGTNFNGYSNHNIIFNGTTFAYTGNFNFTWSTFVFGGATQQLKKYSSGSGIFNDIIFNSSVGTTLVDDDITILGDLEINSGYFDPDGHTVFFAGENWTNNVGDAGFTEGTSTVVFNRNGQQYCSDEVFNILETNKASGAIRMNGTDVVCANYDWTAGAIDVLSGSFTAYTLADNRIAGGWYLNSGGEINLHNPGAWLDLGGDIHIFGGTFNVYEGDGPSYWPYAANSSIEMSGGVMDFHNMGILISNSALTLNDNITGGVIRTVGGFEGNRADFTPTAGTFEFYGASDYSLSQSNGCTLYNVNINKTAKSGETSIPNLIDKRSGKTLSDGGKSNQINLTSDFEITNNLTVTAGTLNLNGRELSVTHDADIYGTLTMTDAADILNVGTASSDILWFHNGSTGNISNGVINLPYALITDAGSAFIASTSNTINFGTNLNFGGIVNYEASTRYGNINIDMLLGDKWVIGTLSTEAVEVDGDFTIQAGNIVEISDETLIVHGNFTDNATSEFYAYDGPVKGSGNSILEGNSSQSSKGAKGGYVEIDNDFTLYGLMDIGDGDVLAHGRFNTASGSTLSITSGSLVCDLDMASNWSNWYGTYNLSTGLIEYTSSNIFFRGTSNLTGGTVRGGRTVNALSGAFQPSGGTLELIGSSGGHYVQLSGTSYANDFLFNRTTNYYTATDLTVNGDVVINSGEFKAIDHNIYVGGDWTNNSGAAAFNEGTGTVIFNGSGAQFCSDETFNILEVNNSLGNSLRMVGTDVVCEAYDWTKGGIMVYGSGSFTTNDLLDDGVYGNYYLNTGQIALNNLGGSNDWVDLNAYLHIIDGTMTVSGIVSDWSFSDDASIEMSGGILDFTNCGINIYNSATNTFTENITGGTIRTAGGFQSQRADFQPTAGLFEFYGTSDVNAEQIAGSTLYNVNVDKSAKGAAITPKESDGKIDQTFGSGKANTVSLTENLKITNFLTVTAGTLKLNGYALTVENDCDIYGTLTMDNAADVFNMGNAEYENLHFYNGSVGNFSAGNAYIFSWIVTDVGSSFTASTANTITFNGNGSAGLANDEPSTRYGNVIIDKTANRTYLSSSEIESNIIDGDFTINAGNIFEMQNETMIIHGTYTDNATSTMYVYNAAKSSSGSADGKLPNQNSKSKGGYLELDNNLTLNGLMDLGTDGNVLAHANIGTASTGVLTINGGSFIADQAAKSSKGNKAWQYFNGTLNLTDGVIEITNNSFNFTSTAINNISGGVIKCGKSFSASTAGTFQPSSGLVQFISNAGSAPYISMNSTNYFNDVEIAKGNTIHPTSDIYINGNITFTSGTFDTFGHNIYIGGDWTNNVGDAGFGENTGTVIFNGANEGDINTDETFYNLSLDKTNANFTALEFDSGITVNVLNDLNTIDGTMEMNPNTTLNVDGDVTIASNSGLNANDGSSLALFIGGNFTDNNTTQNAFVGYNTSQETVTFDGSSDQIITGNPTREIFANVIINKSGGDFRPASTLDIAGDLLVSNGDWHDNVSGLTHYFEGDFHIESPGGYRGSGITSVFKGSLDQDITYNSGTYFTNITIDKTDWAKKGSDGENVEKVTPKPQSKDANSIVRLMTGINMQNTSSKLIIDEGILNLNGNTILTMADIEINDGGTLSLDAGAHLKVYENKTISVNDGGIFSAIGTAGNNAYVTKFFNVAYYNFDINSGGTIAAEHTTFEYIGWNGVNVKSGAIVDNTKAFNYCTFRNAKPGTGGMLGLFNDQELTCNEVTFEDNGIAFNAGVLGSATNDVTMVNAHGNYAGPEYEFDDNSHLHWTDIDVELDLTVMLEGSFNGVDMNTGLRDAGVLPLSQPFNEWPWSYSGTESVAAIPANVVDWVLVQLRDSDDPANADAASIFEEHAAFLLADGSIVDLDGISPLQYTTTYNQKLYPVIVQYNHLAVISPSNVTRNAAGKYAYDFRNGAFGGVAGEKEVSPGVWAMIGGDSFADGVINSNDVGDWNWQAGDSEGYHYGDMDMNGYVDNKDKNDVLVPNLGYSSQVNNPAKGFLNGTPRVIKK